MLGSRTTIALAFLPLAAVSCAPRANMCAAPGECAAQSSCVAGRCQPERANVRPAIMAAKRIVLHPVDVAFVRRGEPAAGAPPAQFTLGRGPAALLLRFSVALTPATNIVEAYVVLRRDAAVDDDPEPISLHAARIVEGWDGRSTSWSRQPRALETRTPATTVDPAGPSLVRVDVRDIVRQWRRHDPADHGIAVVAEGESRTGVTFAFRSSTGEGASAADPYLAAGSGPRGGEVRSSSAPDVQPYLELYVR